MLEIMGRKYASVTCADVVLYDLICGNPVAKFDTLKMTSVDQTADNNDVQGGKGNPILARISANKQVALSIQDAVMSMTYLSVITGGDVVKSGNGTSVKIYHNEKVTCENGSLALTYPIATGTTAWIAEVDNGVISERKARFDFVGDGEVKSITGGEDDFRPSTYGLVEGNVYQVFYEYLISEAGNAQELTVFSDIFAKTYKLVGDTELYNTATGRNEALQIEVPRYALDNSFTFELNAEGTAAVFDMNGVALADDDKRLIVYRIYSEDAATDYDCLGSDEVAGDNGLNSL